MDKQTLLRLLDHMHWADRRTLESLQTTPSIDKTSTTIFLHLLTTEKLYLSRLSEEDPFPQNFWPGYPFNELGDLMRMVHADMHQFLAQETNLSIVQPVRYRNSKGAYYETPKHEMLIHLTLHGEHHRGQIAQRIRESGGIPAVSDYIIYVREMSTP